MINSSPEGLGNQTYTLSFLHEFPELKVQDHRANPEMLFPCLCHQILSKLAERQKRLLLLSTTQGREMNRGNHTAYNELLFLTSATLLGTPSPSTSRAKTVWGMNPLTPQHRLNASRRRCISSSVTETSPKQTKGKISWNKHRKSYSVDLIDRRNRSFNCDQQNTYLVSSLPHTRGSTVLTPLDP